MLPNNITCSERFGEDDEATSTVGSIVEFNYIDYRCVSLRFVDGILYSSYKRLSPVDESGADLDY